MVHLGAVPAPGLAGSELFRNNTVSTYNVLRPQGIWDPEHRSASSETVLGLPFNVPPPYAPVDEEYPPRPQSAYALAKATGEEMAGIFAGGSPK